MQVSFTDRMEIADKRVTADGFLATTGRIARTGLYEYSKRDLGVAGNPNDLLKIYRPEETVFSDESMASFAHRPITIGHPPVMVDASNWSKYSKGHIGSKVRRDGDFVDVDMLLMDSSAIDQVKNGTVQLSAGYLADVEMTPGETPEGEHYDGVMVGPLKGNHAAIVPLGRAGSECRIGDAWPTEVIDTKPPKKENRKMATFMLDGLKVDLSDEESTTAALNKLVDAKAAAEKAVADAATAKADAEAKAATEATVAATALADSAAKVATLEAEKATLAAELVDARDPAKLRDAAAEYGKVAEKAKALGGTFTDADNTATIKRSAVNAKLGDVAKDWTDAQVDVSFATLTAGVIDAAPDAFRDAMSNRNVTDFADAAAKAKSAREAMIAGFTAPRDAAK